MCWYLNSMLYFWPQYFVLSFFFFLNWSIVLIFKLRARLRVPDISFFLYVHMNLLKNEASLRNRSWPFFWLYQYLVPAELFNYKMGIRRLTALLGLFYEWWGQITRIGYKIWADLYLDLNYWFSLTKANILKYQNRTWRGSGGRVGCILFARVGMSSPHAEGVGPSAWQWGYSQWWICRNTGIFIIRNLQKLIKFKHEWYGVQTLHPKYSEVESSITYKVQWRCTWVKYWS